MAAAAGTRPGRQRSEAADQAILGATLDLLAEVGFGGLTMAAVIQRAGVSSATLYRRWQTKEDLVAAALASLHPEVEDLDIDTGDLDGDIERFVRHLADSMSIQRRPDVSEAVAVQLRRDPEFRGAVYDKFVRPRIDVLRQILCRARERGELGSGLSPEVAMTIIAGPLNHRAFVLYEEMTPAFVRTATTAAQAAVRAVAPA